MGATEKVTPAAHVRIVLTHHRFLGTPFETAWLSAIRSLPKGTNRYAQLQIKEWKEALRFAKSAYRDAYYGFKPDAQSSAVVHLAEHLKNAA